MYVYIESEHNPEGSLWTVGFYDPNGKWIPESDHNTSEKAARRVAWLNGGQQGLPASFGEALNSKDGSYHP